MSYLAAALVTVALVAGAVSLWSRASVVRARRRMRDETAAKVLGHARTLHDHQLWVAVPFPELVLDAARPTEDWGDRPRHWARVISASGGNLLLADQATTPALGCEWYVYATRQGQALDFCVVASAIPDGIDAESILPSDTLFAGR